MPQSVLELEYAITQRLGPWQAEAISILEECKKHGVAIPPAITRALGMTQEESPIAAVTPQTTIESRVDKPKRSYNRTAPSVLYKGLVFPQKPDYGEEPEGGGADWAPVPLCDATTGLLIIFLLSLSGPHSTLELHEKLLELRPDTAESTIPMAIPALIKEGWLEGDSKAWKLLKPVKAVLIGERLWCSPKIMRGADQAAIRRVAIQQVLRANPKFLTVAQVSHILQNCDWLTVEAPPNKVKADLRYMGKLGLARKQGAEWKLMPKEKEGALIEKPS